MYSVFLILQPRVPNVTLFRYFKTYFVSFQLQLFFFHQLNMLVIIAYSVIKRLDFDYFDTRRDIYFRFTLYNIKSILFRKVINFFLVSIYRTPAIALYRKLTSFSGLCEYWTVNNCAFCLDDSVAWRAYYGRFPSFPIR